MIDIYAKTFMTATRSSSHVARDVDAPNGRHKRWPWRGRRWKPIDLDKL